MKYERIKDGHIFYVISFRGIKMLCDKNKKPLKNLDTVRDFENRFKEVV